MKQETFEILGSVLLGAVMIAAWMVVYFNIYGGLS